LDSLILASTSPRRKELLSTMNISFVSLDSKIEENIPQNIEIEFSSEYLAKEKVKAAKNQIDKNENANFILGADTTIVFEDKVIGKPKNYEEAKEFLSKFQGKTQKVITGIALLNLKNNQIESKSVITEVKFKKMTEKEIEFCLSKNEWQDAAGGYKIQGFSSCFIERINGSYSNVVGLPISEVYDMLKKQCFEF